MTFWLNIDKPTKRCTIHRKGCIYERNKKETPLKGINKLKQDGGWLPFLTTNEINEYFNQRWKKNNYILSNQCPCMRY
jgi:hypothetical protein